jgi:hypothetical protein
LLRFIEVIEQALGKEAIKDFQPMQPGDVVASPVQAFRGQGRGGGSSASLLADRELDRNAERSCQIFASTPQQS